MSPREKGGGPPSDQEAEISPELLAEGERLLNEYLETKNKMERVKKGASFDAARNSGEEGGSAFVDDEDLEEEGAWITEKCDKAAKKFEKFKRQNPKAAAMVEEKRHSP